MNYKFLHNISRVFVILLATLSAPHAYAQIGEPRNNKAIGVTGGVAMNTIGFDPTIKQNLHIGPTIGVVARFTSEKYFKTYSA